MIIAHISNILYIRFRIILVKINLPKNKLLSFSGYPIDFFTNSILNIFFAGSNTL
jgi:hypothetical protein